MREVFTLLFFVFIGCSAYAQQAFQLGLSLVHGYHDPGKNIALSWYLSDGAPKGHVLRLSYMTTSDEKNSNDYYALQSNAIQLDVAKRWYGSRLKKINAYIEMGITGMAKNEWSTLNFGCDCIFAPITIDTGLRSHAENYGGHHYTIYDSDYVLFFLPGATAGGGIDVNIGKHSYLGIHSRANIYFWAGKKKLLSYLLYGLNTGYRF